MANYYVDTDGVSQTYATLASALAALPATFTEDNYIYCSASTNVADTTTIPAMAFNTTTNYRLHVIGSTNYRLEFANADRWYFTLSNNGNYANVTIQGIRFIKTAQSADYQQLLYAYSIRYGQLRILNCAFIGASTTYRDRIIDLSCSSSYSYSIVIANCLIVSRSSNTNSISCAVYNTATPRVYAYYNTVKTYKASGTANANAVWKDNIIKTIIASDAVSTESDYNMHSGAFTMGGANDHQEHTFTFVDENNLDFHLQSSDTGAQNLGTSLASDSHYIITTDYDEVTRGDPPDCGAFEYVEAPPITGTSEESQTSQTENASSLITGTSDERAAATDEDAAGEIEVIPLIIDHTAVTKYSYIPESYKTAIKQMWLSVPGESHSGGYRTGLQLLEALDSTFAVSVQDSGTPEMPTSSHLRASRATWGDWDTPTGWLYYYGEEDWFTSAAALAQTKTFLQYAHDQGFGLSALGFGWCWDATWHNDPTETKDPVYKCGWAGSSVGGPEGDLPWGLDSADTSITGNSICLDTYLDATQQYIDFCAVNNIDTKVFFTTGPVDNIAGTENAYQRFLKHERIRDYVNTHGGILFDYADILCWNNAGSERTTSWTDGDVGLHTFQHIATDNLLNLDGSDGSGNAYHIGERGALRLGKALWVMLAMADGWDGEPESNVSGPSTESQTLQIESAEGGIPVEGTSEESQILQVEAATGATGAILVAGAGDEIQSPQIENAEGSFPSRRKVTVRPEGQGGDYTSLASAIAGEKVLYSNLVSQHMILSIEIGGDWTGFPHQTNIALSGFITNEDYYLEICTDAFNRAGPTWKPNGFTVESTDSSYGIQILSQSNVKITGLQLFISSSSAWDVVYTQESNRIVIDSCFGLGLSNIACVGHLIHTRECSDLYILNSILLFPGYNHSTDYGVYFQNFTTLGTIEAYFYNCIFYSGGSASGVVLYAQDSTHLVHATFKNCYASSYFRNSSSYVAWDFITSYSEWPSASQVNGQIPYTSSNFTNVTTGAEDFSLPPSSAFIGIGTNLSSDSNYPFTWDIEGETRRGEAWSIGATEDSRRTITLALSQKKQAATILALRNFEASSSLAQKKPLIDLEGEIIIESYASLRQKKQSAAATLLNSKYEASATLRQKKSGLLVSGTSHDNIEGSASLSQKKQNPSASLYVVHNFGDLNLLQKKSSIHVEGVMTLRTMFQKKQSTSIRARNVQKIIGQAPNLIQKKQGISITGTSYRPYFLVSFNANDGTGVMTSLQVRENQTATLPACAFTNLSYPFEGWSLTSSGPVAYFDQDLFYMHAEDITLYAKWAKVPVAPDYYLWYEPLQEFETFPVGNDIEWEISDDYAINQTEEKIIRTREDYVAADSLDLEIDRNLHSAMKNSFYTSLLKISMEENKYLHDRAYTLKGLMDLTPSGDNDSFMEKVDNLSIVLNVEIPSFFYKYVTAKDPSQISVNRVNQWIRMLLETKHLSRRYVGSRLGYLLAFTRMQWPGTVYLQGSYRTTESISFLNPLYGRLFRVVDKDELLKNIPGASSVWPNVPTFLEGAKDYPTGIRPHKFDAERTFDEGYNEIDPPESEFLQWDRLQSASPKDKGLILDFTLDRVLHHENSLGFEECLMDDPWFKCMDIFIGKTKKASDKVSLGTQLQLTGNNTGRMSEYLNDTGYDDDRDIYTHPNIKARFQVFYNRFNADANITRVVLGTGALGTTEPFSFWVKAEESVASKQDSFPTALQAPVISALVGLDEQTVYGGYTLVHPTVRKIDVEGNELITTGITIPAADSATDNIVNDADRIVIQLPHTKLAPGSCSFDIDIPIKIEDRTEIRVFSLTESFNPELQTYNTITKLWKRDSEGNKVSISTYKYVDYFENREYLEDEEIAPLAEVIHLTITHGATSTGSIAISLRDEAAVNVDVLASDDTLAEVATKVAATVFPGWIATSVGNVITFTSSSVGKKYGNNTLTSNGTSITGTFEIITEGVSVPNYCLTYTDDLLIPGDRQTYPTPGPGQIFSSGEILYEEGQLILYTKLSRTGELQAGAAITGVAITTTCNYSINSYRVKDSPLSSKNNLIGISEIGVYNASGHMVAYGTFPKIIYNPNIYHLSLNVAIPMVEGS